MPLELHRNRRDHGYSSCDRRDDPDRPNHQDRLARLRRDADHGREPVDPSSEPSRNAPASHSEWHWSHADFPARDDPDRSSYVAQSCRRDAAFPVKRRKDYCLGADRPVVAFLALKQKDYYPGADRPDAELV